MKTGRDITNRYYGIRDGVSASLLDLWNAIGRMALAGELSLGAARRGCGMLMVVASFRRNREVKTLVAQDLGTGRRQVRELLGEWRESFNGAALLEELRRRSG